MSSLQEVRWRLLTEQLETLADKLSGDEQNAPENAEEQTIRLLTAAILLLRDHEVNKRGQCRFCGWTRWKWRVWHRRPECTVFQKLDRAMSEALNVVWWELFTATGSERSLVEVREWVAQRTLAREDRQS